MFQDSRHSLIWFKNGNATAKLAVFLPPLLTISVSPLITRQTLNVAYEPGRNTAAATAIATDAVTDTSTPTAIMGLTKQYSYNYGTTMFAAAMTAVTDYQQEEGKKEEQE